MNRSKSESKGGFMDFLSIFDFTNILSLGSIFPNEAKIVKELPHLAHVLDTGEFDDPECADLDHYKFMRVHQYPIAVQYE